MINLNCLIYSKYKISIQIGDGKSKMNTVNLNVLLMQKKLFPVDVGAQILLLKKLVEFT
jgi:hypothetical protein